MYALYSVISEYSTVINLTSPLWRNLKRPPMNAALDINSDPAGVSCWLDQ